MATFWERAFIRFTAGAFHKLLSVYVFSYFPFGVDGRMWDLILIIVYLFTLSNYTIYFYSKNNISSSYIKPHCHLKKYSCWLIHFKCDFPEWEYLCSCPDGNSVNLLIRLIFRLIIFNVFIQSKLSFSFKANLLQPEFLMCAVTDLNFCRMYGTQKRYINRKNKQQFSLKPICYFNNVFCNETCFVTDFWLPR